MAVLAVAAAALLLPLVRKDMKKPSLKALAYTAGCGSINRTANYFLLLALAVLPASVQYPFVTGGTMIVSTLMGLLVGQRPTKREILSIALSFVGIMILIFVK
jgi:multidrug transporter EmrE-like cation transporter